MFAEVLWTVSFPGSVAIFGSVFLLSYILLRTGTKHRPGGRPLPCLPSLPIIGSLLFIPMDFVKIPKFFMDTAEKLGPVFAFYSGNRYTVVLNGRYALDSALVKRAKEYAGRSVLVFEKLYTNVDAKGIIDAHYDDEYKKTRRLTVSVLKQFGFGAKNITETRVQTEIDALHRKLRSFKEVAFNPSELMTTAVSNVILGIIFGDRFDYDDPKLKQINDYITTFMHDPPVILDVIPILRFLPSVRRQISTVDGALRSFFEMMTHEIKSASANDERESFLRSYVSAVGEGYDMEGLLYILRDLVMAGTDTTENTLLWGLVALVNYPEVQQRVRMELDSVVPWESRCPSYDDKHRLPYTEATIAEVLRWRTIVPLSLPHETLSDTELDGYHVPAGTQILANLYSAHMDRNVWIDPEKFNPGRFLDGDGKFVDGNRVVSFSLGYRSCMGEILARQVLFLFFTSIVQRFHIHSPDGQPLDEREIVEGVFRPRAFEIQMVPRNEF